MGYQSPGMTRDKTGLEQVGEFFGTWIPPTDKWNVGVNSFNSPGLDAWGASMQGAYGQAQRDGGSARRQQMELIHDLHQQASGVGPSLAQAQLKQATDRNMAQAMALAQGQRGAPQAGLMRGVQQQRAGIGQQMAGDSALLRLQEQMQARQMMGGLIGGMRGQDNDMTKFSGAAGIGVNEAQRQAQIEKERMQMGNFWQGQGINQGNRREETGNRMGLLNALGSLFAL